MEAKELRLGNFVIGGRGVPKEITEFDLANWDIVKGGLEPLKLTEEWLLKFSFIDLKDNSFEFWKNSIWSLLKENDKLEVYYGSMCLGMPEIKYVHELQNLYFALTNEEL